MNDRTPKEKISDAMIAEIIASRSKNILTLNSQFSNTTVYELINKGNSNGRQSNIGLSNNMPQT